MILIVFLNKVKNRMLNHRTHYANIVEGENRMKKLLVTALVFVMFTVLTACSGEEASGEKSSEDAKSEEQDKELKPKEVIAKSSEKMNDWAGIHYVIDGKQVINASKGEQTKNINQDISIESKMTMDPVTLHMTGNIKMQGQQVPIESYYAEGKMYSKTPPNTWMAIEGMNLDKVMKQSQGQNPSKAMDNFSEILDELSADGNNKEYIKMEEKDNTYIIEMDLDEEALSKVMDIVKEQSKGTIQQLEKMGIPNVMENMKVSSMKQIIYIDKESFEQKKVDQKITMEMSLSDVSMTIDSDMTIDIKGKVDEKITVPMEIKNSAQVVDLEKIQQSQQKQNVASSGKGKQKVIAVKTAFKQVSTGIQEKMKLAQGNFDKYINGNMSKAEFDKFGLKVKDFVDKKRSQVYNIKVPKNEPAFMYYSLSKNTMMSILDVIETIINVPERTDKQGLKDYVAAVEQASKEMQTISNEFKQFKTNLVAENPEYKDVFK